MARWQDVDGAAPLKAEGNRLFAAKKFSEAAEKYTDALAKACPCRVPVHSTRRYYYEY